jgi:chromosome segregation ATPase
VHKPIPRPDREREAQQKANSEVSTYQLSPEELALYQTKYPSKKNGKKVKNGEPFTFERSSQQTKKPEEPVMDEKFEWQDEINRLTQERDEIRATANEFEAKYKELKACHEFYKNSAYEYKGAYEKLLTEFRKIEAEADQAKREARTAHDLLRNEEERADQLQAQLDRLHNTEIDAAELTVKTSDNIKHPAHYTQGKLETIEIIDAVCSTITGEQAPYVANIIKYTTRFPFKNGVEDLKKAHWYLERLIKKEELRKDA